jgi:hypothetical protein
MPRVVTASINPFPGLRPFGPDDHEFFFGRGREIDELINGLCTNRFLAVLGVSGCGKSSLVYAGLIPVLSTGLAGPLAGDWEIYTMWPGDDPIQQLQRAIRAPLASKSHALLAWAREQNANRNILIFVDQFEEIFAYREKTLPEDGGSKAALFVDMLLMAVSDTAVPVHVVFTMRTDYLGEAPVFRGLSEALNEGSYLVPRLSRLRQQAAIERPVSVFCASFQPRLVQELLNQSEGDPDKLPVLQHLLKVLWEARSKELTENRLGELNLELYTSVGGWQHAIENDAENILSKYPHEQSQIKSMFQWLAAPGTAGRPIRRRVPFAQLPLVSGLSSERAQAILHDFAGRGFIRLDSGKEQLVDFMHESVMWQWPKLRQWISEEAEDAATVRFIQRAAEQQQRLTGSTLASAVAIKRRANGLSIWISRYIANPKKVHELLDWIQKSKDQVDAEAKRERRLRQTFVLLIGLICGALAIAGGTFLYNWQSTVDKNRQLANLNAQLKTYQDQLNAALLATNKDRQDSASAKKARELVAESAPGAAPLRVPRNPQRSPLVGPKPKSRDAEHSPNSISSPASVASRANITIQYFAKQSELTANPQLVPWLRSLGFTVQIKTANFQLPSNKIWYGSQVDATSVRTVAYCVLAEGFALRQISPLSESNLDKGREKVIQIGWSNQGENLPLLTPAEIEQLTMK